MTRETYIQLAYAHLATVLPSFLIGTYLLLNRKGTPLHKALGKLYMTLMLATALVTLAMQANVGPQLLGHFGFIHIFSFIVLYNIPNAYLAARRGNIRAHRGYMLGLYIGGLLIAGSLALEPGRMLHGWLFG